MLWISIVAFAVWAWVISTGMRLPYLRTDFGFQVRAYLVFPLIVSGYFYWGFIYKKAGSRLTGYQQAMKRISKDDRVKVTLWIIPSAFIFSGFIAWTSIAFPAWATMLLANESVAKKYEVADITTEGGPMWSTRFDLQLTDIESQEVVSLLLTKARYEQHKWKRSEMLCALGRRAVFGTVIDTTTSDIERCESKQPASEKPSNGPD